MCKNKSLGFYFLDKNDQILITLTTATHHTFFPMIQTEKCSSVFFVPHLYASLKGSHGAIKADVSITLLLLQCVIFWIFAFTDALLILFIPFLSLKQSSLTFLYMTKSSYSFIKLQCFSFFSKLQLQMGAKKANCVQLGYCE